MFFKGSFLRNDSNGPQGFFPEWAIVLSLNLFGLYIYIKLMIVWYILNGIIIK